MCRACISNFLCNLLLEIHIERLTFNATNSFWGNFYPFGISVAFGLSLFPIALLGSVLFIFRFVHRFWRFMKSSKNGNSAYRSMKNRQDNRSSTIVGVLIGFIIAAVVLVNVSANEDHSDPVPASGLQFSDSSESEHPISKYAKGRSIEEIDALIDGSADQ